MGKWVVRIPKTSILLLISLFPLQFFCTCPQRGGGGDTMKNIYSICNFRKNVCWEKKFGGGGMHPCPMLCAWMVYVTLYIQLYEPRYSLCLKTYCCKFYWSINHWLSFIISPISLHVYWNVCTCDNSINSAWCLFFFNSFICLRVNICIWGDLVQFNFQL